MKKNAILLIALAALALAACSPKLTSNLAYTREQLQSADEVVVIDMGAEAPANAVKLGTLKVGDSGFTATSNGTYDKVLDILKEQARLAGGNVLHITSHKSPDMQSTIHRVTADVYYVENVEFFTPEPLFVEPHPDYALIYLYRGASSMGALVNYDVYANDTKVYRCTRNSKAEVKILEQCEVTIWAKTESRSEIRFLVEPGKDYFIECSVSMGAFVGRPDLKMIDATMARSEYNSIITE